VKDVKERETLQRHHIRQQLFNERRRLDEANEKVADANRCRELTKDEAERYLGQRSQSRV